MIHFMTEKVVKRKDLQIIILCGGEGVRLWPLSNSREPKPFIKFPFKISLLEQAYKRAKKLTKNENIWIVTTKKLSKLVKKTIPKVETNHIVLEESAKNTAPAITLGMKKILGHRKGKDFFCLVMPADHYIPEVELFQNTVESAMEDDGIQSSLFTFGIKPTSPKSEYGYIEATEVPKEDHRAIVVKSFVEKPNSELAKKYVQRRNYFWNSGIFLWKSSVFFEEIEKNAADIFQIMMKKGKGTTRKEMYKRVPSISIDHALMEKSEHIRVMPSKFEWCDLGDWDSIYSVLEKDEHRNVSNVASTTKDARNSLLISTKKKKQFFLYGLENLVLIEHDDVCLITSREKVKELKAFVKDVKSEFK